LNKKSLPKKVSKFFELSEFLSKNCESIPVIGIAWILSSILKKSFSLSFLFFNKISPRKLKKFFFEGFCSKEIFHVSLSLIKFEQRKNITQN